MNSQETTNLINMLIYILIPVIFLLFALIGYAIFMYFRNKNKEQKEKEAIAKNDLNTTTNNMQNKQSIFKFMEFDEVTDNMIIQKNGEN